MAYGAKDGVWLSPACPKKIELFLIVLNLNDQYVNNYFFFIKVYNNLYWHYTAGFVYMNILMSKSIFRLVVL